MKKKLDADNLSPFKGIVRPFELVDETRLIQSTVINWRTGKFFKNFIDTISREELKTI
jgi:hypothetical protein